MIAHSPIRRPTGNRGKFKKKRKSNILATGKRYDTWQDDVHYNLSRLSSFSIIAGLAFELDIGRGLTEWIGQ